MVAFLIMIYCFLILYLYVLYRYSMGLTQIRKQKRQDVIHRVSVIVCAHNEEANLPACLEKLALQNYPGNKVEFILVNDRSTDQTPQIIDAICKKNSQFKGIHIYDELEYFAPKKRAIDTAIGYSSGEIILLTDADGRPGSEWVSAMVSYYSEDVDMVLGYAPYDIIKKDPIPKKILALEYLSHASISAASAGAGYPITCVGTNMSYRKKVYLELKGFGPYKSIRSGDDDLFLTLVRESGQYKITYAPVADTHVHNRPPETWDQFFNQRIRYASKGFDYPFKVTFSLMMYYIFYLLIFAGFIIGLFKQAVFYNTLAVFLIKSLADILFMIKAGFLIEDRRFLHWMPVAELLHLPYVLTFGLLGQIKQYRWADSEKKRTN
jgi:cellulose synthase/poly-beta-1,6-N-acetylglucosamine synthase-like glycosyltransferase